MPHLYLDTLGNATVGIGHLVPDFAAALSLPFSPAITGREWHDLTTAPKGMRASAYRLDTQGRLTDAQIDALLEQDIAAVEALLRARFPEYASWPDAADAAMRDVAFNAGLTGFPKLCAAARVGDWATCALECHRTGISESRNERTAQLFREAALKAADVVQA